MAEMRIVFGWSQVSRHYKTCHVDNFDRIDGWEFADYRVMPHNEEIICGR